MALRPSISVMRSAVSVRASNRFDSQKPRYAAAAWLRRPARLSAESRKESPTACHRRPPRRNPPVSASAGSHRTRRASGTRSRSRAAGKRLLNSMTMQTVIGASPTPKLAPAGGRVLEDAEVALRDPGDEVALVIEHGDVDGDGVDVATEGRNPRACWVSFACRTWRGSSLLGLRRSGRIWRAVRRLARLGDGLGGSPMSAPAGPREVATTPVESPARGTMARNFERFMGTDRLQLIIGDVWSLCEVAVGGRVGRAEGVSSSTGPFLPVLA